MTASATMTPAERAREPLIAELRNTTQLGRLNHTEAHELFAALESLGWTLTAPAAVKV